MRSFSMTVSLSVLVLAACGGAAPARPLTAQVATGSPAAPGQVLVFSAKCAGMEKSCPRAWASTVDAIVTSGLAFHGYATLDPQELRKDEADRTVTSVDNDDSSRTDTDMTTKSVGAAGIIPIASYTTTKGTVITMSQSSERTVVLTGAVLEDLTLADRHALMQEAGATALLTTQITVGANWSAWTENQTVEVMIKLASASDGTMHWSARCAAASGDFPNVEAAIESAARCVVDAITAPPA